MPHGRPSKPCTRGSRTSTCRCLGRTSPTPPNIERRPRRGASHLLACLLSGYGSISIVHVYVPGWRSFLVSDPSPLAPVEALSFGGAQSHSIVEAVPPSICESTDTVTLVSGVLWNVTVSPPFVASAQVAVL